MTMPLLNGKFVAAAVIDPAKHRYIGSFRPPENPLIPKASCYAVHCRCGQSLTTYQDGWEHYRNGCCDEPQYVDIEHGA